MYKVIKSKYGLQDNQWDSKTAERVTSRCPWKAISSLYEEFLPLLNFKVGKGRSLRFWEDAWAAGKPLANSFRGSQKVKSICLCEDSVENSNSFES